MKNIGILLSHLGPSQLSFYVCSQINQLANLKKEYDFSLFFDNLVPPCIQPNCAVFNGNEIWGYEGVLVATTMDHAILLSKAVNKAKNFFYVWDLEWLRRNKNNFMYNMQAFRHPDVELIARSNDHKKAIENYCNRPVKHVIPDINLEQIGALC